MRAKSLILLMVALVAAKIGLNDLTDRDVFWHIWLGLEALERHELPAIVERSWTVSGDPYLPNDWLAQVILAGFYRVGGFRAVALFKALALAGAFALLFLAAERRAAGNARAAGLALALALPVAASQFLSRPLLFAHVLLAGVLLVVELVASGKPRLALALPPIFVFWVNSHGSWPLGFGVLAAALATAWVPASRGRLSPRAGLVSARRWLLCGTALSVPSLLVNPRGLALVARPFALMRSGSALRFIVEWAPVPWDYFGAWLLLLMAFALAVACWRSSRALSVFELGLAAVLFLCALRAARFHTSFAMVTAPLLAEQLSGMLAPAGLERRGLNACVAGAAVLTLGAMCGLRIFAAERETLATSPVAAVGVLLREGLDQERGFHHFDWGGYLVFRGVPSYVDGRLEPFIARGIFARYLDIESRGDLDALERMRVRWLLTKPGSRLSAAAARRSCWKRIFRDRMSELWRRHDGSADLR
jgi:hypothetical protein